MPLSQDTQVTIGNVTQTFLEVGGQFSTFVSNVHGGLERSIEEGRLNFGKAAEEFNAIFRDYAYKVEQMAFRAESAGRVADAEVFIQWRNYFEQRANEFLDQQLDAKARLDKFEAHINENIKQIGKVGKFIGPVFDIASITNGARRAVA